MEGLMFEPISPGGDWFDDESERQRLQEIEQILANIDKEFKTNEEKLNQVSTQTACAMSSYGTHHGNIEALGSAMFPTQHVNIHPRLVNTGTTHQNAKIVNPPAFSGNGSPVTGLSAASISEMLRNTVLETVRALHENQLLVCSQCLNRIHYPNLIEQDKIQLWGNYVYYPPPH